MTRMGRICTPGTTPAAPMLEPPFLAPRMPAQPVPWPSRKGSKDSVGTFWPLGVNLLDQKPGSTLRSGWLGSTPVSTTATTVSDHTDADAVSLGRSDQEP
jgi:hypothetical protein